MSGLLYICGANCTGRKATASDPLAHYRCPLWEPHCHALGCETRKCYRPRMIDQHVVEEINLNERTANLEQMADTMTSMGGWESETTEEEKT